MTVSAEMPLRKRTQVQRRISDQVAELEAALVDAVLGPKAS
jgi:hypothetical protein